MGLTYCLSVVRMVAPLFTIESNEHGGFSLTLPAVRRVTPAGLENVPTLTGPSADELVIQAAKILTSGDPYSVGNSPRRRVYTWRNGEFQTGFIDLGSGISTKPRSGPQYSVGKTVKISFEYIWGYQLQFIAPISESLRIPYYPEYFPADKLQGQIVGVTTRQGSYLYAVAVNTQQHGRILVAVTEDGIQSV